MRDILYCLGCILGVVLLTTVIVISLMIPINYCSDLSMIAKHKSIQETLCKARNCKGNSLARYPEDTLYSEQTRVLYEMTTITHKIVETNKWLAAAKYWNSIPVVEFMVPDAVDDLKPVH